VSQVNLLPPDILQLQQRRRLAVLVVAAGVGLLLFLFAFYLFQQQQLSGVNDDIAAQEATNAAVTAQVAGLEEFAVLQEDAQAKEDLLAGAYAGEISFSGLLMDMSRVIPSDAYLTSLTAQANAPAVAGTPEAATGSFAGNLQASGVGLDVESLSTFLTRLESVDGWVNPWMTAVSQDTSTGFYTFASGVDMTEAVVTERGKAASNAP
jgi:Tfp pilus assembly protein PilN